jgi:hypothetical protein
MEALEIRDKAGELNETEKAELAKRRRSTPSYATATWRNTATRKRCLSAHHHGRGRSHAADDQTTDRSRRPGMGRNPCQQTEGSAPFRSEIAVEIAFRPGYSERTPPFRLNTLHDNRGCTPGRSTAGGNPQRSETAIAVLQNGRLPVAHLAVVQAAGDQCETAADGW